MNRNPATKYVPPLNVVDGQSALKLTMAHFTAPQLSTNGNSMSTMNSLSSNSSATCASGSSPLENLPKKFVSSMRTLFDIMDDKRTGFVRLSDIEARWQDDGSKGLPHGVIDCLRRVTPASGMLSFERFCAGLKICLLRNQTNDCPVIRRSSIDSLNSGNSSNSSNNHKNHINININTNNNSSSNSISINNGEDNNNNSTKSDENNNNNNKNNRSNSALNINGSGNKENHDADEEGDDEDSNVNSNINICRSTSKISKNSQNDSTQNASGSTKINGDTTKNGHLYSRSSLPVQRTLSLPKLSPSSDGDSFSDPYIIASLPSAYAPPKPPRTALLTSNGTSNLSESKDRYDKAEIRNALQNWQMNVLMNEWEAKDKRRAMAIPNHKFITRGTADGSPNNTMANQTALTQQTALLQTSNASNGTQSMYPSNRSPTLLEFQKKSHRRREVRRHTLQNGIDYNMLKRIRHLEEEKDLLLDGLHAVEKAQEWYFKQIALIQEKMKRLSRGDGQLEQWSEANKERLDLQRARIMDVNRHLASLEESWGKGGFPMHMNLAVRNHSTMSNGLPQFVDVQVNQLKVQNRQLTEEVSQKSERITDLEMERKSLYRELVQYQQQQQQLQQQLIQKQGHILCANDEVIF